MQNLNQDLVILNRFFLIFKILKFPMLVLIVLINIYYLKTNKIQLLLDFLRIFQESADREPKIFRQ